MEVEASAAALALLVAAAAQSLPDLDEGARPLVVPQEVLAGLPVQGG